MRGVLGDRLERAIRLVQRRCRQDKKSGSLLAVLITDDTKIERKHGKIEFFRHTDNSDGEPDISDSYFNSRL